MKTLKYIILIITFFVLYGCFPTLENHFLKKENLTNKLKVDSPSKVFLADASMVILDTGFLISNNFLSGTGSRYWIDNQVKRDTPQLISLDSVQAITVYESKMEGARAGASVLLYLFGVPSAAISVYCLSCPKCCFGSCPTIYSFDGLKYNFETELFSYSIAKQMEENDLDHINQEIPDNGIYKLKVTNEAMETHYINNISLILASHPKGTKLYSSSAGKYIQISKPETQYRVTNREGIDVTSLVNSQDEIYYRSSLEMVKKMYDGICYDWLDVKAKVPQSSRKAKLLIRYRNTLLSTILFYEVVLGSQGINAVNWINKMNKDELYASQFNFVYQTFSGIGIYENNDGELTKRGHFGDAGPLNWKYSAGEIYPDGSGELNIRLQFVPDNFMIDYIALDYSEDNASGITLEEIFPAGIKPYDGEEIENISGLLKYADDKYLVTNPGDSYMLDFKIEKKNSCEQTVFIKSRGYYNEWIRGNWVRNNHLTNTGYTFDLFDTDGTFKCLVDNWLYGKDVIEKEFFKTKIPLRGSK